MSATLIFGKRVVDFLLVLIYFFRLENDVATTLPLKVVTQRNSGADVFRQKLNFTGKDSKIAFCATLWGTYGQGLK